MAKAVSDMRAASKGKVLDNTGVKTLIRRRLMELLGVWRFATPTNHDDLRSAARIALLGMLKDEQHNKLLADVVRDHLAGETWEVKG
jgi:UDP-glucose 6-dehydrogenase